MFLTSDPKWRGRIFRYAPVILWAGVVLFLATSAGSASETSRFIGPLLDFFFPGMAAENRQFVHFLVRKTAHFTEYGIFAFFAARAFLTSSKPFLRRRWFLFALLTAFTLAVFDEGGQTFRPDRTGALGDVFVDMIGAFTYLVITRIIYKRRPDHLIFSPTLSPSENDG
ncbi:MAG: VanZ family protein [Acidobacteria bacterium]|nr:VanZ family protein [Acidobacteriota bacterium]